MKGLYVHIPFCEHICFYCDFCKRVPKNENMIDDYLSTLKNEYSRVKNNIFDTIYIGGGTPSMLNPLQLETLLSIFLDQKPIEFTIEVNPESYSHEKGLIFKKYGVNRVSLGVQTFNESILAKLNRRHTNPQVFNTVKSLKAIGITNISIDLIFALPGQTIEMVKEDLDHLNLLGINHLSYYSLILEKKTTFYNFYQKNLYKPLDIDIEADMFEFILNYLPKLGFNQYEVSNFSKLDITKSQHNLLYWSLKPYEAIGAGAHGFDGDIRYYHTSNITQYIGDPSIIKETQTDLMKYQDYIIFGLRKSEGISLNDIKVKFNKDPRVDYPKIKEYIQENLMELNNGFLRFTRKGLFVSNQILGEFL